MLVIVNDSCGQMCNKLYNQINVIATGLEYNIPVCYYGFDDFESFCYSNDLVESVLIKKEKRIPQKIYFKAMSLINSNTQRRNKGYFFTIEDQTTCSKTVLKISKDVLSTKKIYVEGWPFVNLSAIRKHIGEIRKYYSPSRSMEAFLKGKTEDFKSNGKTMVGVHIRRGDYKNWRGGAYYFSDEIYISRINELNTILGRENNVFFIFSNETIDKSLYLENNYEVVFPNGNGEEDFHLLTKMDYIIGPPSTFNGMASFFGNVPRFIIQNAQDSLTVEKMKVWLVETDNDGNVDT